MLFTLMLGHVWTDCQNLRIPPHKARSHGAIVCHSCVRMRNLLAVVIIMAIIRAKIHHKNVQKTIKRERVYCCPSSVGSSCCRLSEHHLMWGWVWFCLPLASQGSQDLSLWKCSGFGSPCQRVLPPSAICIQSGRKWWQSQWQSAAALPRGKPTHLAERGRVCNKFLHFEGLCFLTWYQTGLI